MPGQTLVKAFSLFSVSSKTDWQLGPERPGARGPDAAEKATPNRTYGPGRMHPRGTVDPDIPFLDQILPRDGHFPDPIEATVLAAVEKRGFPVVKGVGSGSPGAQPLFLVLSCGHSLVDLVPRNASWFALRIF